MERFSIDQCSMATKASRRRLLRGTLATITSTIVKTKGLPFKQAGRPRPSRTPFWSYQQSNTLQYFALGDSVASGHGLGSDAVAFAVIISYPYWLATSLEDRGFAVETHHFACSGATSTAIGGTSTSDQVTQVLNAHASQTNPDTLAIG